MKKIKSFMMMMATMAFVFGVCSCGSDDDEPEVAVATQVAGSYTGLEIMTVSGEDDEGTKTFEFTKATDSSVDMTIPEYGEGGMSLPKMPVKGILLTKSGNTITGKLSSYSGTVTNASGAEKAYTVSDVTVLFSDKNVVVTFELKYGNMPFVFAGKFSGTKQ
jgi:hypothetical protein